MAPHNRGFLTFASPLEMTEHFASVGIFETTSTESMSSFLRDGSEGWRIDNRTARNHFMDLLRQAWEKLCRREGFLEYEFANKAVGFHVNKDKAGLNQRISWGRQGEKRSNVLRNIAKKKVWEYGVSVTPNDFPFPHLRLKGRVLFSDMEEGRKAIVIPDKDRQFRLRRSICSGWRNKAWHGRLLAFIELLVGDSPYVAMPAGSGQTIRADAMPIMVTTPVTTRQKQEMADDAEESDFTTLGQHAPVEEE